MNKLFGKIHIISKFMVALVGALAISELLVKDVFIGYTPSVRPDLADRLVTRTLAAVNADTYISFFTDRGKPRPSLDGETLKERLSEVPPQQIVAGVYAKESNDGTITEIHYDEIQWIEVPYRRKSGEVVVIKIPKGTVPPPPGLF